MGRKLIRRWVGDKEIAPRDIMLEMSMLFHCRNEDDVQAAIEVLNKRDEEKRKT